MDQIWYNYVVMKRRNSYYISRKNFFVWLMALLLTASAVTRILFFGVKGTDPASNFWGLCALPAAACLLYAAIILFSGKERFYKTAIPIWMIALYFFFRVQTHHFGYLFNSLYFICLFCFAVAYQWITCGKIGGPMLLLPMYLAVTGPLLYLNKNVLYPFEWHHFLLSDLLMLIALFVTVFAIRLHPANEYHPTWGDRIDGRRIHSQPPMEQMIPYIMVNRNGSTNLFCDSFEITAAERYVRQKRREGLTNFGLTHVLMACYARSVAKYPAVNRFISGQKVYSRGEDIVFCMTIKKEMTTQAPETIIKLHLSPRDTAEDIYRKMNAEVEKVKATPLNSNFDLVAHAFTLIPGLLLKAIVWLLKTLDYFGLIPAFLLEVSPFHGSLFFTSMGSLGIPPVFHHLYDFGNLPVFGSFGCKRKAYELTADGTMVMRKYIDFNFSMDERIVDGFYCATFLKYYKRLFLHPDQLDMPPEEIVQDIP